jgi:hypothetical protein
MVMKEEVTPELKNPSATAIALTVTVAFTENGREYNLVKPVPTAGLFPEVV